jgi:hypothetical protein
MMPPGMDPSQGAPMAGGYPAAPGMNPMMPPGNAYSGGTPMADPSQIYGPSSSQQGQPSGDPSQASPGLVPGPTATGGMPGGPMMGPMGPMGPTGAMGAMPGGAPGMSSIPGMPPSPNGTGVNAVAGMPPLANAQSPAPPGSINPMAAAQQPVAGPSGVPSAQASPLSQAQTPSNQNATQVDTVHVTDTDSGGVALDPTPIRYPVNRPITWVNSSSAIIQIASEDNSTFDSGPMAPGDTYVFTPSLIGSFYYHDKLHPWVRGVLVATAAR